MLGDVEWVGGVDGVGGVGEAVRSSVCRVLVGGLDLLDHDLLALQQVCLAAAAMGAGLAVLDCRVVAAARLAMCHGLDGLHDKLRALRDRLFICCPAPSVEQQVGNDARDLAQQQRHARNATHAMSARHILDIANNVIDDSQFMQDKNLSTTVDAMQTQSKGTVKSSLRRPLTRHGYLFTTELNLNCTLQCVLAQAWELLLVFDHRGALGAIAIQMDGVKRALGGAQAAADALVGIDD